jgi:flagellar biosynthesis regulator FlbT
MKKVNSILKAIRDAKRKYHQETKHMTMQERMVHDRQQYENFKAKLAKIDFTDGRYTYPFLIPQKEVRSIDEMVENNEVIKAIREVRKQHYQKTKHMTLQELMDHDRLEYEKLKIKLAKMDFSKYRDTVPFVGHDQKVKNESQN